VERFSIVFDWFVIMCVSEGRLQCIAVSCSVLVLPFDDILWTHPSPHKRDEKSEIVVGLGGYHLSNTVHKTTTAHNIFVLLYKIHVCSCAENICIIHSIAMRGWSQTKTWFWFYRIRVPVGPWCARKIFLSSKMMNYQPQHIQKREIVEVQKITYNHKSKK